MSNRQMLDKSFYKGPTPLQNKLKNKKQTDLRSTLTKIRGCRYQLKSEATTQKMRKSCKSADAAAELTLL